MAFMGVDEAKLAVEFGRQLRAVMEEKGDRLAAGAIDEEKLATTAVARLVQALSENYLHATGKVGGLEVDLYLSLAPKEATP